MRDHAKLQDGPSVPGSYLLWQFIHGALLCANWLASDARESSLHTVDLARGYVETHLSLDSH